MNKSVIHTDYEPAFRKLGDNLKYLRNVHGLSLKELSISSNYDSDLLSWLESGIENIRYNKLLSISKSLNVDFKILFCPQIQNNQSIPIFVNDDFLFIFRNNILKELKRKNKQKTSLCVGNDLSLSAVSRLLNGKIQNPTILTLFRISSALDIELTKLFERS